MRSNVRAALAAFAFAAGGAWAQPADTGLCTTCHGPNGNSAAPAVPSIAGQPAAFLENQLVMIREGLRELPAMVPVMRGLSDAQISALAKHFAAQPVSYAPGPAKAELMARGAAVSRGGQCGSCHLPDYRGQQAVPRLGGQQEVYLLATMKMYRDAPAPGRDTQMQNVLRGIPDADLAALAHYFSHTGK